MVHRSLDVIFQYFFRLGAGVLLVPLALGAIGFGLDSTPTVGIRLWANRQLFAPSIVADHTANFFWPSTAESMLLLELLETDSFANRVLVTLDPDSANWPAQRRDNLIADLRQNVDANAEGAHLFVVTYRTRLVERGKILLTKLVEAFGAEIEAIDAGTVSAAEQAVQTQFTTAKQAMENAIKQAETYRSQHPKTDTDPVYQSMVTQAQSLTDRYLDLQAQIGRIQQSQSAVATLRSSYFRIVDPAAVFQQQIISKKSMMLKLGLGGLGSMLALEGMIVYVVAKRDPRIRSVEDVRRRFGLRPLGSAPRAGSS